MTPLAFHRCRVLPVFLLAILSIALAMGVRAQVVEGKDYELMNPPHPIAGDKIEVVEFFSYGCPYCAQIEPALERWLKQKPADVEFRRISIDRGERWAGYAHAFYALQMLNEEARLTPLAFNAVHKEKQNLDTPDAFFDWAAKQGVDRAKLETAYRSETVARKMKDAEQARVDYKVRKIPTLFIDGRYHLIPEGITEYDKIPAMLDELIRKARAARPSNN